jgi:hypothetical protein
VGALARDAERDEPGRRNPNMPPADSANWASGPRRRLTSLITFMNSLSWFGNVVNAGEPSVSVIWTRFGVIRRAGPLTTSIRSSAACTVRFNCGRIVRTGSSMSDMNWLSRPAASLIVSNVVLRLSIVRNSSSMPRRNCSTERIPPAIGAAKRLMTSPSGS